MSSTALLILRTAKHRYAARHSDLAELRQVLDPTALQTAEGNDRSYVYIELGTLLDPTDISEQTRRHALLIPLRRRYIALLVDAVEAFREHDSSVPLPKLLHNHLAQPWAIGVLCYDDTPIVQLDLRAIARSVLLQRSSVNHNKGSITYASGI